MRDEQRRRTQAPRRGAHRRTGMERAGAPCARRIASRRADRGYPDARRAGSIEAHSRGIRRDADPHEGARGGRPVPRSCSAAVLRPRLSRRRSGGGSPSADGRGIRGGGEPARYEGAHHLRPLAWPALPIAVEFHHEPNRPNWLAPPQTAELLELTRPSSTEIGGLLGPIPAAHAVLLAGHSWAHEPLGRLLDLIDVIVVLESEHDRRLARDLALRWGLGRVWRTTIGAADALLERQIGPRSADLGSPPGRGA